jgi:hypothetical protein
MSSVLKRVRVAAAILAVAWSAALGSAPPPLPAPVASYSTSFPLTENPISEGGAWSNIGLDWTTVQTANGHAHGTQPGTGAYTDSYAHLSGFTADQEAQAVVFHDPSQTGGTQEVELLLRWADSAHMARGYECNFSYGGGYAEIVRWNGPLSDFTYLARVSLGRALVTGDVVKAHIIGNVITVFFNGSQVNQATDSTWVTGQPGMAFWKGSSSGPNTALGFSSYTATSLGSSTPVSPTISSQPANVTVTAGQTATFSVTATGTPAPSYQWQRSNDGGATWASIGTNNSSYTTAATGTTDNGARFQVIVSNSAGSVTSTSAILTVTSAGGGGGGGGTTSGPVSIDSGGGAVGTFVADADFSGGSTSSTSATIDLSAVTNPGPMAVYQSERWGAFTYAIPGLTAGVSYTVRLHFAEIYWTNPGQRVFNVAINGKQVLSNFDIVATAGAPDKANVQQFTAQADGSGTISIVYSQGSVDWPKSSGLEIIAGAGSGGGGGGGGGSGGGGTSPQATSGGGGGHKVCAATGFETMILVALLLLRRPRRG